MRQVVTGLLVLLTITIGAPMVGADPSAAALIGQVVDAGGRGSVGRSVELVRDGAVVSTVVTAVNGEFRFAGIAPGSYVVRTMVNNQPAGTRVSVNAGESIPVTVVLPSLATASPQFGAGAGLLFSMGLSGGMALTGPIFTGAMENGDTEYVETIQLADVQNFIRRYQPFFANIPNGSNINFLGEAFRIGPYGTN